MIIILLLEINVSVLSTASA